MERKRLYSRLLLVLLLVAGFYLTRPLQPLLFGFPGVKGNLALEAERLLVNPEAPPDLLGDPQPSPGSLPEPPEEVCVIMYPGALTMPGIYPGQEGYVDATDELNNAKTFVDGHLHLTFIYPEFVDTLSGHPTNGSWTNFGRHCISPKLGAGLHVIEVRVKVASKKYTYSWAYDIES